MLTLQFIPFAELANLETDKKLRKILKLVKENKIVLLEGRLSPNEEADLIERTMQDVSKGFTGIELCTIYPENESNNLTEKLKTAFVSMLVGNRQGLTVVGPASIVKEIKRDPNKIQLLTENLSKKRRKRRKRK